MIDRIRKFGSELKREIAKAEVRLCRDRVSALEDRIAKLQGERE